MTYKDWFEKEYPYIGRKYDLGANDLRDAFDAGRRAGLAEADIQVEKLTDDLGVLAKELQLNRRCPHCRKPIYAVKILNTLSVCDIPPLMKTLD